MPTDELRPPTPTPHLRVMGMTSCPNKQFFLLFFFWFLYLYHDRHVCSDTGVNTVCNKKKKTEKEKRFNK